MIRIPSWLIQLGGVIFFVVGILSGGCAERDTKPDIRKIEKPRLSFNPRNLDVTSRWLIQQAAPVRAASIASHEEQSKNPLRKDRYNAHLEIEERWDELLDGLIGKQVVWPAVVQTITTDAVGLKCMPVEHNNIEVSLYFSNDSKNKIYRFRDNLDGQLDIGMNIDVEEAKRLDPGSRLFVRGTIQEISSSVARSSFSNDHEYILIKFNKLSFKSIVP